MNKKGFITLLSTEDYLDAVLVLNKSLKKVNSIYPLIVAISSNLINTEVPNTLKKNGITYEVINQLTYNSGTAPLFANQPSTSNTASKIEIFKLTQYKKLCYIDADCMVLENIDNLLDYPDGSITTLGDQSNDGFSALFVFCPQNHNYTFYKTLQDNLPVLDGDLFSGLWFPLKTNSDYKIPYLYCVSYQDWLSSRRKAKMIHFLNKVKPWKLDKSELEENEVLRTYKQFLFD